jgi:predicted ATPase with chaperone activity
MGYAELAGMPCQPLEAKAITISQAQPSLSFLTSFQRMAAMNL